MKLLSLYIIHEDGRCLYDANFVPNPPPSQLVTGLLTAMQNFVEEMTGSYVSHFSAAGYTFIQKPVGPIYIVVAISDEFPFDQQIELTELGINFLKRYGEYLENWNGDMSMFYEFETITREILKVEKIKERIDPQTPLNALTLLELPEELQDVAKFLLEKKEVIPTEYAKSRSISVDKSIELFERLVKRGNIGRILKETEPTYFII